MVDDGFLDAGGGVSTGQLTGDSQGKGDGSTQGLAGDDVAVDGQRQAGVGGPGGGQVGVTAASASTITADELIDLYYSLKAPYRKNAVWVLNDSTMKIIRKLKDGSGQYLWQPALKDGEANTILGRPYFTSPYAPAVAAGAKSVLFGDLNYYWIGDREGITFRRLNELYAGNGQVGFLASKRLDGKTVLPEAIKVLQQHA